MWERYCRGVNAIVYMVDSADSQKIEVFDILKHRNYLKSREKKQLDRLPISHQTEKYLSPGKQDRIKKPFGETSACGNSCSGESK